MMTKAIFVAAAVLLSTVSVSAQTPQRGTVPQPHDSNSLHKLGNAIQYPFRKGGENISKSTRKGAKDVQYGTRKNSANLSINAHRTVGQNSVERRKNGAARHNTVITPKGHLHRLPS